MLVLTRKPGEQILLGDDIVITVLEGPSGTVRIGIDAPRGVKITRAEVMAAVIAENRAAAASAGSAEEGMLAALGALSASAALPAPDAGLRAP